MPVFIDGHHLITPTSVAKTGTGSTATINTNGSVTFSSCATLSLNGVFSADYDNYIVICRHLGTISDDAIGMRNRNAGTDATTGYTNQYIVGDGTSVLGSRITTYDYCRIGSASSTLRSGFVFYAYGPFLSQPTAFRSCSVDGVSNARLLDWAVTHSTASSYDSMTLITPSSSMTGLVCVYGAVK